MSLHNDGLVRTAYLTSAQGFEKGSVVLSGTTLRGPLIIRKNCRIDLGCYVGPYTSVGDNTVIRSAEIEDT